MQKSGKLELTWVGKYDTKVIEPRIFMEDFEKSYGDPNSQNMLIHGDNLIALQALIQDFAGKIKCIYIDPPFNTGEAFENYDDNLEESIWLTLMRQRLELIHELLADDGTLFVHIDDANLGYLMVLLDEIFLRANRLYTITFKQGSATGHKAINPGCVTTTNFILMYAKDKRQWIPNKVYTARGRDSRYNQYIVNVDAPYQEWTFSTLLDAFATENGISVRDARKVTKDNPGLIDEFVLKHADSVIRTARPDMKNVGKDIQALVEESKTRTGEILFLPREGHSDIYLRNGERILFYKDKLKFIDGEYISGEPLTTLWDDILSNNLHNEGGVAFPKGKKPEHLIKRVLELSTKPGDLVLDSFLGSGTTAAVAHKMGRRWIGVELGEQAYTHCKVRLDQVIDGEQGGISKAVDWHGGSGYHFYELAESLLVQHPVLPIMQVNPHYTFEMLCEAICKIEGFKYTPEGAFHGYSSEKRFIHITKEFINAEYIKAVSATLSDDQSLLIYGTKIQSNLYLPENIEVKKIPKDLLQKCFFESEVR
jgi:adenine-specific DNA-methyltransferase